MSLEWYFVHSEDLRNQDFISKVYSQHLTNANAIILSFDVNNQELYLYSQSPDGMHC